MKAKIEKFDHLGRGICYIKDKITFVPFSVPGDEVEIEIIKENKRYNEAKLINIIKKSGNRVESFCPYFGICGGCQIQNISYLDTLEYKKERVQNILNRADINTKIDVIKNENDKYYRNKIELKVKDGKIGFYKNFTHELVEIKSCSITKYAIINFLNELKNMNIKNGDVTLRANFNDELLISIKSEDNIKLNENVYPDYKVVGIIHNDKCIYGKDHFMEKIGNLYFEVSYNSFFQINSYINEHLFNIIKENTKDDTVLDLYSGVGTLSIMASKSAKKVYAIEYIQNAVINAIKNARINRQDNINFILGKVEDKIKYIDDKITCAIVDPPRKGLDDITINKLLDLSPNKIIYISCETQKLTEDLKKLQEKYNVEKIYALDMFSYTYHTECVCILKLK